MKLPFTAVHVVEMNKTSPQLAILCGKYAIEIETISGTLIRRIVVAAHATQEEADLHAAKLSEELNWSTAGEAARLAVGARAAGAQDALQILARDRDVWKATAEKATKAADEMAEGITALVTMLHVAATKAMETCTDPKEMADLDAYLKVLDSYADAIRGRKAPGS